MGSKNLFLALSSLADYIRDGPHGSRLKLSLLFIGAAFNSPLNRSLAMAGRRWSSRNHETPRPS